MDRGAKITIMTDINAREIHDIFRKGAEPQDGGASLLDRVATVDFFECPVETVATVFPVETLRDKRAAIEVCNQEILCGEGADDVSGVRLSATLWMTLGTYFQAQAAWGDPAGVNGDWTRAVREAFATASASFHFPARVKVIDEKGVDVGTGESAPEFFLQSDIIFDRGLPVADLSDWHDDEAERQCSARFSEWFRKQLTPGACG